MRWCWWRTRKGRGKYHSLEVQCKFSISSEETSMCLFPCKGWIASSKVAIGRSLLVYRTLEIECPYYSCRPHVKGLSDQALYLFFWHLVCSKSFYHDRDRFCHSYCVCNLHLALFCQPCRYYVFSCISCHITS